MRAFNKAFYYFIARCFVTEHCAVSLQQKIYDAFFVSFDGEGCKRWTLRRHNKLLFANDFALFSPLILWRKIVIKENKFSRSQPQLILYFIECRGLNWNYVECVTETLVLPSSICMRNHFIWYLFQQAAFLPVHHLISRSSQNTSSISSMRVYVSKHKLAWTNTISGVWNFRLRAISTLTANNFLVLTSAFTSFHTFCQALLPFDGWNPKVYHLTEIATWQSFTDDKRRCFPPSSAETYAN